MSTPETGQPRIVERAAQPYVAIRGLVTMQTVPQIADRFPEVFGWLATRGIEPSGAPFLRYNIIDMARLLDLEAGVPVGAPVRGSGSLLSGVLPAGRYAMVTHVGPFDRLSEVTKNLLTWAAQQGLDWDMATSPEGERWGCRIEQYETNPAIEPDPDKWETVLAFRLAD